MCNTRLHLAACITLLRGNNTLQTSECALGAYFKISRWLLDDFGPCQKNPKRVFIIFCFLYLNRMPLLYIVICTLRHPHIQDNLANFGSNSDNPRQSLDTEIPVIWTNSSKFYHRISVQQPFDTILGNFTNLFKYLKKKL